MIPSMSVTFRPASTMALCMASIRRSRLDTPGTRPRRLCPAPTMAQTSRSSRDGSIMLGLLSVLALRRWVASFDQFANARHQVRRRGIDTVEQRIDRLAADRVDLGFLQLGVIEKLGVFHRGVEGGAQGGDAIGGHAPAQGERGGPHLL